MGALAHFILSPCLARADAVPKPENDVVVSVTYQGKPLADVQFKAVLLKLVAPSELRGPAGHGAEQLARRERQVNTTSEWATLPLTEVNGWHWTFANVGDGHNGQVRFHGFWLPGNRDPSWPDRPPQQVRLAVYLPSERRWFLTEVAETRPYLTFLRSDLRPDGTGSLIAAWESLWQRVDLPIALGLTLLVELSIVLGFGLHKHILPIKLALLLLIGIVVNVVSLPVVWFVTLKSYSELGRLIGFGCFLLAELGATVFEGLAYAWPGRLGLRAGLGISLLANSASMVLGLFL
jgi:hypothetical protein